MPVDKELAQYIEDLGIGTVDTDVFAGEIPAGVVNAIGFTVYPGGPPEHVCGGNGFTLEMPRVQVRVRNTDEDSALYLANILASLLSRVVNTTINGVFYRTITVLQTPGILYRDGNDRPNYGFNVDVEKAPSALRGPLSPGTMADGATVGTIAWSNPDNAKVADGSYATAVVTAGAVSHYLRASNFGFAIPTSATIRGIQVEILRGAVGAGFLLDSAVRLIDADGNVSSAENKADVATLWGSQTRVTYGGLEDLWSATWIPSHINDSDFGVAISVTEGGFAVKTANVDHIRMTVGYST